MVSYLPVFTNFSLNHFPLVLTNLTNAFKPQIQSS